MITSLLINVSGDFIAEVGCTTEFLTFSSPQGGGFRDRGFSRGGPRGGSRGRQISKPPKEPLKFEEDFDFESSNAKFDKENIIEDLKKLNISKCYSLHNTT